MKANFRKIKLQMMETIKDCLTFLHNKLCDANLKRKNNKELQAQYQRYQNQQILYHTWQLQLQYELFVALSTSSPPINLRKLEHANDLIPLNNCINKNGIVKYYFLWEKHENHQRLFSMTLLTHIMNRLNHTIQLFRIRFLNSCYNGDIEAERAIQAKPLTIRGYQIIDCQDYKKAPDNYIIITVVIF